MSLEPVFFTDRDLGKKFPEMLRAAGLKGSATQITFGTTRPTKSGYGK